MKHATADRPLKVGELAARTGLSVRALHYYEEIGLLVPSHRTSSGHRQYSREDVVRLQQLKSLRALGFTLQEVRERLRSPSYSVLAVLEQHLARAREQLALQARLADRLALLVERLRSDGRIETEDFLHAIEAMTIWEDELSAGLRAEVKERGRQLGPARVQAIERGWLGAILELRAEMARGTDPKSDRVRELIRQSHALTQEFCGGNAEIEAVLRDAYRAGAGAAFGLDSELRAYLEQSAR